MEVAAPLWTDGARPELTKCPCLCQGFPPVGGESVGLSCSTWSLGHGEVLEGLGSIGISLALNGSD